MIDFKKIAASSTPLIVELTRYLLSGVYRDLEKQALQIATRLYFFHVFALVSIIFSIISVLTIAFMSVGWFIGTISFVDLNLMFFVTACVVLLCSIIGYFRVTKFLKIETPQERPTQLENLIEQVALVLKKIQEQENGVSDQGKNSDSQAIEKRIESMENSILLLIQAMESKSQSDVSLKYSKLKDL